MTADRSGPTRVHSPQGAASTFVLYMLEVTGPREARIFGIGRGKGQLVAAEGDGADGPALRWAGYRLVRAS